jgi:hypothetical protein
MAKFECSCGHIIRDQTDALPYKGMFIPDEDDEVSFTETINRIAEFIQAKELGRRDAFLQKIFGEAYPHDLDDLSILGDLISYMDTFRRFLFECENCGRVWIQKHSELDQNIYASYWPESDVRGVLKSQRT